MDPELSGNDPTAGATAGGDPSISTATAADPTPAAEPTTPSPSATPVRTYTDSDMAAARRSWQAEADRRAQARIAEERQRWEAERNAPVDDDPYGGRFQSVERRLDSIDFQRARESLSSRFKDFSEHETEVLQFLVDNGFGQARHISYERALEIGYKAVTHDKLSSVDVAAIEKAAEARADARAVQKYLGQKTATASATPKVEGAGGATPGTTRKIKTKSDMREGFEAHMARMEST